MPQGDFELENYPIPEKYFSCPIEELFELLGSAFVRFARRHKRYACACPEQTKMQSPIFGRISNWRTLLSTCSYKFKSHCAFQTSTTQNHKSSVNFQYWLVIFVSHYCLIRGAIQVRRQGAACRLLLQFSSRADFHRQGQDRGDDQEVHKCRISGS